MTDINIGVLVGLTLTAVSGMEKGSGEVMFTASDGRSFRMYHDQGCCESVQLEDVCGNPSALLNSPLLLAREDSNEGSDQLRPSEYADSWTWTFYSFATAKGYVTLRWLGESNGYYGESVDFVEVK